MWFLTIFGVHSYIRLNSERFSRSQNTNSRLNQLVLYDVTFFADSFGKKIFWKNRKLLTISIVGSLRNYDVTGTSQRQTKITIEFSRPKLPEKNCFGYISRICPFLGIHPTLIWSSSFLGMHSEVVLPYKMNGPLKNSILL